jgi:hypothetical protein
MITCARFCLEDPGSNLLLVILVIVVIPFTFQADAERRDRSDRLSRAGFRIFAPKHQGTPARANLYTPQTYVLMRFQCPSGI